jgi:hypothetical protein
MAKFKLIGGHHYEINPKYNAAGLGEGNIRHHPERMIKFERGAIIESDRPLDEIYINKFEKVHEEAPHVVTEERKKVVSQILEAPGSQWNESDRAFLEGLKDSDFAKMMRFVPKLESTDSERSDLGEDVTHKFQQAYDNGFKVFVNPAGKHQVTKGGKVLNHKPLIAAAVEVFVEKYMAEEK